MRAPGFLWKSKTFGYIIYDKIPSFLPVTIASQGEYKCASRARHCLDLYLSSCSCFVNNARRTPNAVRRFCGASLRDCSTFINIRRMNVFWMYKYENYNLKYNKLQLTTDAALLYSIGIMVYSYIWRYNQCNVKYMSRYTEVNLVCIHCMINTHCA